MRDHTGNIKDQTLYEPIIFNDDPWGGFPSLLNREAAMQHNLATKSKDFEVRSGKPASV